MKIYYIQYLPTVSDTEFVTETFSSRRDAERRVADMKKDYKVLQKAWQAYIISGRRTPRPEEYIKPPHQILEREFEISKEGVRRAFESGVSVGITTAKKV